MAKPDPASNEAMEEILASIRRMISEDDRNSAPVRHPPPRAPAEPPLAPNVSRLFEPARQTAPDAPSEAEAEGSDEDERAPPKAAGTVVELAIAQAIEDARAEVAASHEEAEPAAAAEPFVQPAEPDEEPPPVDAPLRRQRAVSVQAPRPAAPLLSPEADVAVASAFDQLARTMLSGGARTIDEVVEDVLRPMLRTWLDNNLPTMVERMVREEIERVSRGRR